MFRDPRSALLLLATLLPLATAAAGGVPQTVGLFVNTPHAFEGYTLFGPREWPATYLIDMDGNLIRSWSHTSQSRNSAYLLENGDLLRCGQTVNPVFPNIGAGGHLERRDWNGNLLWEYAYSDSLVCGHHDIEPMPNGNVLVVAWELRTPAEAIAAGRNPALMGSALWPERIVELQPVGANDAIVVWMWQAWDHLVQDFDSTKANYGVVADHPELININERANTQADWLHFNAVAYDEGLDQIVVSPNRFQEVWVIDHGTTTEEAAGHTGGARGKGGDLLYRWGKPANYGRGAAADQRLFNNHNVHWIPPGRPGAGNLLIFNNGTNRFPSGASYSSVEEVVTSADGNGDYPDPPPGLPHEPADATWTYTATPTGDFYSPIYGGVERQPSGSTLIMASTAGRIFEIHPTEGLVWEYVIPVDGSGPVVQGTVPASGSNAAFRAPRYALDYPAFDGRDLTPLGPIEIDPVGAPEAAVAPPAFALAQNHPNPFRPSTTITFTLRQPARARLDVHDVAGRRVATLLDGELDAGVHRRAWNAEDAPSGVYYYTLRVDGETATRRMTVLR